MQRPQNTFLHSRGIGKLKHVDVAYLWVQDEIRSDCECAESGAKKTSQTWDRKHSAKQ